VEGELQALCVVDLFNEGLDVPDVDRVVMLRPTESKVIFLQQLGRGLRAAERKLRLKVIDFVGNHRVFASRLTHLLSLGNQSATWTELKRFLKGGTPDLPEGCLLDLEIEAKELMLRLLPKAGAAVVEAYRSMRDDALVAKVRQLAGAVRASGRPMQTAPLNSYDRRIVHNAFKDDPELTTWSPPDDARVKRITIRKRPVLRSDSPA
jgi:hypothetical protein